MERMLVLLLIGLGSMLPAVAAAQVLDADVRRAEEFVRHLERGAFAAADSMVSPAMREAGVTPQMLEQTWAQLTSQGGLAELRFEAKTATGELQVVDFAARFGAQPLKVRVVIDAERRVSGFRLLPATPAPYVPPAYVDTTAFEELAVEIGAEPWQVGGTLTVPRGVATSPVVVLVHGSGAHDRDETIGPSRPFRDLAWGLASRGVAVLRYEKRTWAHGSRMQNAAITVEEEVVEDALAALAVARAHARVDGGRVYLAGHSLGGILGPEIAVRDGALAGLVLMAGTPRPLPDVVIDQLAHLAGLESNAAPEAQAQIAEVRAVMERLRRRELPGDETAMGAKASYYYDLMDRPALDFLARVRVPVLVLQGGRDYQVTRVDYELWQQALAGREDARFEFYPELSHLFVEGTGTATPQEYLTTTGYVAARVIEDIAGFVKR
ncbi:MAG TPA: alpha/beta fold hydrolase [Longimicrobiales bacterium]|nr:alpha/beta fold hydrolase [Longimicrobiales bacterium]